MQTQKIILTEEAAGWVVRDPTQRIYFADIGVCAYAATSTEALALYTQQEYVEFITKYRIVCPDPHRLKRITDKFAAIWNDDHSWLLFPRKFCRYAGLSGPAVLVTTDDKKMYLCSTEHTDAFLEDMHYQSHQVEIP